MVVLRSGRETYSSIEEKIKHVSNIKGWFRHTPSSIASRIEQSCNKRSMRYLHLAEEALNYFNLNHPQKYKLLNHHSVKPTSYGWFIHYHINFTAQNTDNAAAPVEMFFTELTKAREEVSVRLCVSLGPENSLSGDKLNGCYLCHEGYNVWHPKGGGFVRGNDALFKTVQDICDINQSNAITNPEKHLHSLKQVCRFLEPEKEREYISEQVDDASLYATETLNYYNQFLVDVGYKIKYELVKPGFVTRVMLPTCLLFHVNFTAKVADDATAREETFFSEITSTSGVFSCKMCRILEPNELVSGEETGNKTNGCYYCHEFNNVWHPRYGGFLRGGDSLYMSEEELRETKLEYRLRKELREMKLS
ncbi:uncharacterized protein LOC141707645 [Apium graveolens]|uniref:uncharacterized protein LOC141707645 n=1 Tax=Apium graveolens TaxID=4045 RepID=UPI003D78D3EF